MFTIVNLGWLRRISNGHWKGRPLLSLRLNLSGEFWGWQFPTVQILLKVTNLRPFWIKSRPWVMMFLNDRWGVLIDPAMSLGTNHLNLFNEENLQNSKHFFDKVNCRKSRNHASFIIRPESSNMKPQSIPVRRPKNRIEYNSSSQAHQGKQEPGGGPCVAPCFGLT